MNTLVPRLRIGLVSPARNLVETDTSAFRECQTPPWSEAPRSALAKRAACERVLETVTFKR